MTETNTAQSEQVARDFVAWENGDDSKIDVVSESLDMYNPGLPNGEAHHREEVAAYLYESRAAFPDAAFLIEEIVADDNVILAELTVRGTHQGEFKGIPPTGRRVEFGAMARYVVADGKVEECHVYYDTKTLANQLGLTFPTVLGQLPKLILRKLKAKL
ncbi:ester cyclase [Natronoarchaeum mannanilyticum]|uniref:Ester cyclase n=1 Tax=Natronoarchaeum mannanilyticum TaxID=926360 RepID=A0AAV3TBU5_9EURY